MEGVMRNWLGPLVEIELQRGVAWLCQRQDQSVAIKQEQGEESKDLHAIKLKGPDSPASPSSVYVESRHYENDGSNLRICIRTSSEQINVVEVHDVGLKNGSLSPVISDRTTYIPAKFSAEALQAATSRAQPTLLIQDLIGTRLSVRQCEIVATVFGLDNSRISLRITDFSIRTSKGVAELENSRPVEQRVIIREALDRLSNFGNESNLISSKSGEGQDESLLRAADGSQQFPAAEESPSQTAFVTQIALPSSSDNEPSTEPRGVNLDCPKHAGRAKRVKRTHQPESCGPSVNEAHTYQKLVGLLESRAQSAALDKAGGCSTSAEFDAQSRHAWNSQQSKEIGMPYDRKSNVETLREHSHKDSSFFAEPSNGSTVQKLEGSIKTGSRPTTYTECSGPHHKSTSSDHTLMTKRGKGVDKPKGQPIKSSKLTHRHHTRGSPKAVDCKWLTAAQIARSAGTVPGDQRRLLDMRESWLPSEPGLRFPGANVPVSVLQEINASATKKADRADAEAGDEDKGLVAKYGEPNILTARADSSEPSVEPEAPFSWPPSPAERAERYLPPDSSALKPQSPTIRLSREERLPYPMNSGILSSPSIAISPSPSLGNSPNANRSAGSPIRSKPVSQFGGPPRDKIVQRSLYMSENAHMPSHSRKDQGDRQYSFVDRILQGAAPVTPTKEPCPQNYVSSQTRIETDSIIPAERLPIKQPLFKITTSLPKPSSRKGSENRMNEAAFDEDGEEVNQKNTGSVNMDSPSILIPGTADAVVRTPSSKPILSQSKRSASDGIANSSNDNQICLPDSSKDTFPSSNFMSTPENKTGFALGPNESVERLVDTKRRRMGNQREAEQDSRKDGRKRVKLGYVEFGFSQDNLSIDNSAQILQPTDREAPDTTNQSKNGPTACSPNISPSAAYAAGNPKLFGHRNAVDSSFPSAIAGKNKQKEMLTSPASTTGRQVRITPAMASQSPKNVLSVAAGESAKASEPSRKLDGRPTGVFGEFKEAYPNYEGDIEHFLGLCRMISKLEAAETMQHRSLWDDFIIRHKQDYMPYLLECTSRGEDPPPYGKFYRAKIEEPLYTKRIMNPSKLTLALERKGEKQPGPVIDEVQSALKAPPVLDAAPASENQPMLRTPLIPDSPRNARNTVSVAPSKNVRLTRTDSTRNGEVVQQRDCTKQSQQLSGRVVDSYRPAYAAQSGHSHRSVPKRPPSESHSTSKGDFYRPTYSPVATGSTNEEVAKQAQHAEESSVVVEDPPAASQSAQASNSGNPTLPHGSQKKQSRPLPWGSSHASGQRSVSSIRTDSGLDMKESVAHNGQAPLVHHMTHDPQRVSGSPPPSQLSNATTNRERKKSTAWTDPPSESTTSPQPDPTETENWAQGVTPFKEFAAAMASLKSVNGRLGKPDYRQIVRFPTTTVNVLDWDLT